MTDRERADKRLAELMDAWVKTYDPTILKEAMREAGKSE